MVVTIILITVMYATCIIMGYALAQIRLLKIIRVMLNELNIEDDQFSGKMNIISRIGETTDFKKTIRSIFNVKEQNR